MATRQMTAATAQDEDALHALPAWFDFVQRHIFLSALICAEAYLLGTLMVIGWVPALEDPQTWGVYRALGVVFFFLAGAMSAGIALKASLKSAACFKRREWGFALFNFTGVLIFATVEVWASLSERSTNLHPTPADTAVLSLLGVTSLPVSPTVVIVAVLLPFVNLYYGFSQQRPVVKSAEEIDAEAAREAARIRADGLKRRVRAEVNAGVRATQVRGLRTTMDALRNAQSTDDTDPHDDDPNGGGIPRSDSDAVAQSYGDLVRITPRTTSAVNNRSSGGPPRQSTVNQPLRRRVAESGVITVADLVEALHIGEAQARTYLSPVASPPRDGQRRAPRIEAPVNDVLAHLRAGSSAAMKLHAQTLDAALHPRRTTRRDRQSNADDGATPVRSAGRGQAARSATVHYGHLRAVHPQSDEDGVPQSDGELVNA